jgi:hypothetical protein
MKCPINQFATIYIVAAISWLTGCSTNRKIVQPAASSQTTSLSAAYNHFDGGALFTDIDEGLRVLWAASFINGRPYKENLGYFIRGGILISPNFENTNRSACMTAMSKQVRDGKLFVSFQGIEMEVLAIIHTHPDRQIMRTPTPRNDYQFGYMGIHNYVMCQEDLFDAYIDKSGFEVFDRLGWREQTEKIHFVKEARIRKNVTAY